MKNEIIKLEDDKGNIREYKVLLVYKWYKTGKFYMIYTDSLNDLNGNYTTYACRFDPYDLSVFETNLTEEEYDEAKRQLTEMSVNHVR